MGEYWARTDILGIILSQPLEFSLPLVLSCHPIQAINPDMQCPHLSLEGRGNVVAVGGVMATSALERRQKIKNQDSLDHLERRNAYLFSCFRDHSSALTVDSNEGQSWTLNVWSLKWVARVSYIGRRMVISQIISSSPSMDEQIVKEVRFWQVSGQESPVEVADIHIPPTSRAQCDSVQIGLIPHNWAVISCLWLAHLIYAKYGS